MATTATTTPKSDDAARDDAEGYAPGALDPAGEQRRWVKELTAAKKEMDKFCEQGRKVVGAYLDHRSSGTDDGDAAKLNLFWSNVQVMKASLYAKTPKVDVHRTFKDENDDVARVAGTMLERILNSGIESDNSDFDVAARQSIEDFLLPGMGQMWLRYEVETTPMKTDPVADPQTGQELVASVSYEQITHEDALSDYVYWQDFRYSPARTWEDVRWVARRTYLSRAKAVKRFGEKARLLPSSKQQGKGKGDSVSPQNNPWDRIEIWEIWCKEERKVYWCCPTHDTIVEVKDDPLGLEAFLPCPRPLVTNVTTSNFVPRADYVIVQDSYTQIDELTTRIKYLTKACKVVGVYDKQAAAVGRVFMEGVENQLIPVDSWMAFAEKGGLKGAMDFVPIDVIAGVIDKLTAQRDVIKMGLYEVMGISDIMRGSTDPSETLGAQEIKAQFGSARLTAKQQEIGMWAAEAQRIKAQIICNHWQAQTIIERSNIMASVDAQLAQPAVALLKSGGVALRYRFVIDPDSMSTLDWAAERDARTQAITAIGTFVTSVTPLVAQSPDAMPIVLQMLKWMMGGFKVGKEIEGVLDQAIQSAAQTAGPKPPSPAEQAEIDKTKSEVEKNASGALKTLGEAAQLGLAQQVNVILGQNGLPPLNPLHMGMAMQMAHPPALPQVGPPGANAPAAGAHPPAAGPGGPTPGPPSGGPPPDASGVVAPAGLPPVMQGG